MNLCARQGAVVSARHHLPEPAHERWWGGGVTLGCNQLRCRSCGATVRQQPGVRIGRARDVPPPEAVHVAPDWATVPGLVTDGGRSRLYACRCRVHAETAEHLLDVVPRELTDLDLPWACAGHPEPALPLTLDGVPLDERTDTHALALDVLRGRRPVPAYADHTAHRAFWLERLAGLVPAFEEPIARAAVEALGDDDPRAVLRALHWLRVRPRWLPAVDLDAAAGWEGTPNPFAPSLSLGHAAGQALAQRIRWEGDRTEALEAARAWLVGGIGPAALAYPVAEADVGAYVARLPQAVAAAPQAAADLLRPLVALRPEAVALVVRRLEGVAGIDRARVGEVLGSLRTGREEALRAWAKVGGSG